MNTNIKRDHYSAEISNDCASELQLCCKVDNFSLRPRLLTRDQAAAYCGLSVQGFSGWMRLGRLPGPISRNHTVGFEGDRRCARFGQRPFDFRHFVAA